jgi:methyl-accepting chemotaxis protein
LTSQPTLVAPASFIASPIYRGSRRIGTLIFKLPLDAITDVMSQRQGLGRTGESYLVGQDHLMRSDSYKSPTEHSVDGSFRNATKVDSPSILKGLNGEAGIIETHNYLGQEVLSSYIPVRFGTLSSTMLAEIETDEAYSAVFKPTYWL